MSRISIKNGSGMLVFEQTVHGGLPIRIRFEKVDSPDENGKPLYMLRCASQLCCLRGCPHKEECTEISMTREIH